MKLVAGFLVCFACKTVRIVTRNIKNNNGFHVTGLFGEAVKRKGVVADKVGKDKYELWIEYFFL